MFRKKAWIFTHYRPQDLKFFSTQIQIEDYVIGVDKGIEELLTKDIEVDLFIGDFDSLPKPFYQMIEQKPCTIKASAEKDETDTELAFNWCLKNHVTDVNIINNMQGRLDHTLGILSILEEAQSKGINLRIMSKDQEIFLAKDEEIFDLKKGSIISLCPISDLVENVKTVNMKYPLNGETLFRNKTRGISNIVSESPATISKGNGTLLIIINRGEYDE